MCYSLIKVKHFFGTIVKNLANYYTRSFPKPATNEVHRVKA